MYILAEWYKKEFIRISEFVGHKPKAQPNEKNKYSITICKVTYFINSSVLEHILVYVIYWPDEDQQFQMKWQVKILPRQQNALRKQVSVTKFLHGFFSIHIIWVIWLHNYVAHYNMAPIISTFDLLLCTLQFQIILLFCQNHWAYQKSSVSRRNYPSRRQNHKPKGNIYIGYLCFIITFCDLSFWINVCFHT